MKLLSPLILEATGTCCKTVLIINLGLEPSRPGDLSVPVPVTRAMDLFLNNDKSCFAFRVKVIGVITRNRDKRNELKYLNMINSN